MRMTEEEIIQIVNTSMAEEFELDMVDMVIALEHAFRFKIREEKEIRKIRTLGDIHRFVIRKKRETEEG
jgi:acyl carrier protein